MNKNIHREITQLSPSDSFLVYYRIKDDFNFPIHFHPEYEINLIYNGKGVRRVIGDHMEEIDDYEMVLVGPNLPHFWELHKCKSKEIHEITVHIQCDLLDDRLLSRGTFRNVKDMLQRSVHGVLFSKETTQEFMPRLIDLPNKTGLNYFTSFLNILEDLANSKDQRLLSSYFPDFDEFENSDKIKKVHDYIHENFHRKISLDEISELINMTPFSFNRFIKKRTGQTFISYINHVRVSNISRLLLESDLSVGEIAYQCGFNNLANFNRIFKKIKNCTPSEFRNEFNGIHKVF